MKYDAEHELELLQEEEMKNRRFSEAAIEELEVGDDVAYFDTLFGFGLNLLVHEARVTRIEKISDYQFHVYHTDGMTDAEEGDRVWRRQN